MLLSQHFQGGGAVTPLKSVVLKPEQCEDFILQCSLYIRHNPALFLTDQNTSFMLCLLVGKAREWAAMGAARDRDMVL